MLNKWLYVGGKENYFRFCNNGGKVWMLPAKKLRLSFNIYQPSSFNGKVIKHLLPYISWADLILNKFGIIKCKIEINAMVKKKIMQIFKTSDFELAVFEGTPGTHQKITIQVMEKRKILGYCKITDSEEVKALFKREEEILFLLHSHGLNMVPRCLYCGNLIAENNDIQLFIQDTIKTNHAKVYHELKKEHIEFLKQLYEKTCTICSYKDSDLWAKIESIKMINEKLDKYIEKSTLESAIKSVEFFLEKQKKFSFYHADFTPWNMFFENGNIYVFDFEYAQKRVIPFLDIFHFITQVNIFRNHQNADEIYQQIFKGKYSNVINELFEDPKNSYLCYLLNSIETYLMKNIEKISDDDETCMVIWCDLISKIIEVEGTYQKT